MGRVWCRRRRRGDWKCPPAHSWPSPDVCLASVSLQWNGQGAGLTFTQHFVSVCWVYRRHFTRSFLHGGFRLNGLSVRRTERRTSERCGLFQGPSRSERVCLSPGCQVLQSLSFTVSCLAAVPLEAQTAVTRRLLRSGTSIWRPHPGVDRTPLSKPGHNPSLLGAVGHAGSESDLSAFYN